MAKEIDAPGAMELRVMDDQSERELLPKHEPETPDGPTWEDGGWTSLPHVSGTIRTDICVVGLGGSGLAAIHSLLERGITVVGLDAGRVANGAAGSNGGFLLGGTAGFYHQVAGNVGRERARTQYEFTMREIERMHHNAPDIVRRVGSLRIAMSDAELADCEQQRIAMTEDGLPVEHYRGPEGVGLLFPGAAVFNPLARCRRLAQSALQKGARLFENSLALQIAGNYVRTEQALIRCRHVIVAVDGKLTAIFPALKKRVRTARLQMLGTEPTSEIKLTRPVYARFGYEYWQQLPDGRVVLGGFRDAGGDFEWTDSTETTAVVQDRLTQFLRERLRINAPITRRWAASVGYTENGLPIIEEIEKSVWALGGYSGTGNVVGSLCGQAVAEKIATGSSPVLDLFATAS